MSFYGLPHPWDPGYVIPEYVMAEPPERGTFTTQWLPRGTIPTLVPDFLAKPGKLLLGRDDAELGSLGNDTLGAADAAPVCDPAVIAACTRAHEYSSPMMMRKVVMFAGVGLVAYLLLRKKR